MHKNAVFFVREFKVICAGLVQRGTNCKKCISMHQLLPPTGPEHIEKHMLLLSIFNELNLMFRDY